MSSQTLDISLIADMREAQCNNEYLKKLLISCKPFPIAYNQENEKSFYYLLNI